MKGKLGLTVRGYAKHVGVNHSYIVRLLQAGKLPRLPDGSIDPVAADAARQANTAVKGLVTAPAAGPSADYREALTQRALMQTELLKRDLAERDRALIPKLEVFDLWSRTFMVAKTNLRAIPAKLALEFSHETRPAVIQGRLLKEIDAALTAIAAEMSTHKFFEESDAQKPE